MIIIIIIIVIINNDNYTYCFTNEYRVLTVEGLR